MRKGILPIILVVLSTLLFGPVIVNKINDIQLTNRFFALGKYCKAHQGKRTSWIVSEIRNEPNPRERAIWIGLLDIPEDNANKREYKFLFNALVTTRDVDTRNKYVDAFVSGVDSR